MSGTRLILVRHAEQVRDGRFWQHGCPGLTDTGRNQADAVARRLAAEIPESSEVLASNAARAIQTAEPIAAALGVVLSTPTCQLCEMHPGDAEGLTPSEMTARFGPSYDSVPGAEGFTSWMPTALAALDELSQTHHGSTVVAVTHTAVLVASFVAFGGRSLDDARAVAPFRHTSITEWQRSASSDGWELVRKNDAVHLDA